MNTVLNQNKYLNQNLSQSQVNIMFPKSFSFTDKLYTSTNQLYPNNATNKAVDKRNT